MSSPVSDNEGNSDIDGVEEVDAAPANEGTETAVALVPENEEEPTEEGPHNDDDGDGEDITFDVSLPASHSYLGPVVPAYEGAASVSAATAVAPAASPQDSRRVVLPPGHVVGRMPLFVGVVLFPGSTMPLRSLDEPFRTVVRECLEQRSSLISPRALIGTVAIVGSRKLARVGTTVVIESVGTAPRAQGRRDGEGDGAIARLNRGGDEEEDDDKFILRAKQRFRLLRCWIADDGTIYGDAVILDDGPSFGFPRALMERDSRLCGNSSVSPQQPRQWRSVLMGYPQCVAQHFDPVALAAEARRLLPQGDAARAPNEVLNGSVDCLVPWLIGHITLDSTARQALLEERSVASRLLAIVRSMRSMASAGVRFVWFCCRICNFPLSPQSERFWMSSEGNAEAFVNPGGVVHQLTTLRRVDGATLDPAPPSTVSSWFPGYAWRIAYCGMCRTHIGWMFRATNDELHPHSFWGLTLHSVISRNLETTASSSAPSTLASNDDPLDPCPIVGRGK